MTNVLRRQGLVFCDSFLRRQSALPILLRTVQNSTKSNGERNAVQSIFSKHSESTSSSSQLFNGVRHYFSKRTKNTVQSVADSNKPVDYRSLSWPKRLIIRFVAGYRDYGLTALTFHAVVAGISVLFWWYLVYNRYDVQGWLARLGFISPFDLLLSRITFAFGAASFPLAYAIHKGTAPLRVILTMIVTPFIVKNLRKRHIFKLPPGMQP